MSLPTMLDLCRPRDDVARGSVVESEFAADLASVLRGDAPADYRDATRFFANTHPTRGLKDLLRNVCLRLVGSDEQLGAIFRLDTSYGGGKTHALIALVHAARGAADAGELLPHDLRLGGEVRIAAFDGENADPVNGRPLGDGGRAYTPWGEIAWALGGRAGFETVRRSDEAGVAPGADTIRELFGAGPTLILIDELSIYLRKLRGARLELAAEQLTAFLSGLMKAVEASPRAALVYTLAIGKLDQRATDAYGRENEAIARMMEEAQSVSARKATLLNPTEDDETIKVLRRRLFASIDDAAAAPVVAAYASLWQAHRERLGGAAWEARLEALRAGYPLHPFLIETLKEKTATLETFQRVRGMLRLLARTVGRTWATRPPAAHALHLHHVDLAHEPIRQELITRLEQAVFAPALGTDIAVGGGGEPALAQHLDGQHYAGLAPFASLVARNVFMHSLAGLDQLRGITPEDLRYSILAPGLDPGFIDDARQKWVTDAAFLDDRPGVPLRLLTTPNLTQLVRRQERHVDPGEARTELNDRIREIFRGKTMNVVAFPGGPHDVADDAGEGKPYLVVMGYDAAEISAAEPRVPDLVARIARHKGSGGDLRLLVNNVVFVVVDATRKDDMKRWMLRRLALEALRRPEPMAELAEHQRERIEKDWQQAATYLATAIQQAYRHVLYPSSHRLDGAEVALAHTAIDSPSAAVAPGDGQRAVIRALQDSNKLRLPEDPPDAPTFVRDRTPLRKGQITTADLRAEFRRDVSLPMLVGDDVFLKGIRAGIEQGEYVYKAGELIWAKGEPFATVKIDEQSLVLTAAYAREQGIWPRPAETPPPPASDGATEPPVDDATGRHRTADPPPPTANTITCEAPLREALVRILEQARSRNLTTIARLELRPFEAGDAFRLLGSVGAVPRAEKTVAIEGGYETRAGGSCTVEFKGTLDDALPVKDFLEPQLRAAKERDLAVTFTIVFTGGLAVAAADPLVEALTRFGAGAAQVTATAEGAA